MSYPLHPYTLTGLTFWWAFYGYIHLSVVMSWEWYFLEGTHKALCMCSLDLVGIVLFRVFMCQLPTRRHFSWNDGVNLLAQSLFTTLWAKWGSHFNLRYSTESDRLFLLRWSAVAVLLRDFSHSIIWYMATVGMYVCVLGKGEEGNFQRM